MDLALSFFSFSLTAALAAGVPCLAIGHRDHHRSLRAYLEDNGGVVVDSADDALREIRRFLDDESHRSLARERASAVRRKILDVPPSSHIVDALTRDREPA